MARCLTHAEVLALPASVPFVMAGAAFGLSRSAAFDAYHRGDFPVEVLKIGRRFIVPRAQILRALGITDPRTAEGDASEARSA